MFHPKYFQMFFLHSFFDKVVKWVAFTYEPFEYYTIQML
jgi:hypothetical protein